MITKTHWKDAIILVGVTALALAFFVAAFGKTATNPAAESPSAAAKLSSADSQVYEGVITDTHCGAKHSASIGMAAADCTRVCVHSGQQFALVDGDTVRVLRGEPAALKQDAGQRVRIIGTQDGNAIVVESVRTI